MAPSRVRTIRFVNLAEPCREQVTAIAREMLPRAGTDCWCGISGTSSITIDDRERSTGAGGPSQRRPPDGSLAQAGPVGHVAQLLAERVAACAREQDGDRVSDQRVTAYPNGIERLRATQRPHCVIATSPQLR